MRKLLIAALIAAPFGGGAYAVDSWWDARYERRCIQSTDDIPECYGGYAGWARKRCDWPMWYPPGFDPDRPIESLKKDCIQAWLAHGK